MRRMPSGSRPVSGSSKNITAGPCRRPHAIASFCFMPRESSPGSWSALSAISNSSSSGCANRRVVADAVDAGDKRQVLAHREVVEEPRLVRKKRQCALGRHGIGGEVVAGDANRAARGGDDAGQAAQRAGLARAVGPHEAQHLAGPHGQRQVLHGGKGAVVFGKLADLNHAAHAAARLGAPQASATNRVTLPECLASFAESGSTGPNPPKPSLSVIGNVYHHEVPQGSHYTYHARLPSLRVHRPGRRRWQGQGPA